MFVFSRLSATLHDAVLRAFYYHHKHDYTATITNANFPIIIHIDLEISTFVQSQGVT